MPIENTIELHEDYKEYLPSWEMVRAFAKGMEEVKDYLRYINPVDTSKDNKTRNKQYRNAAVYTNVTSRTRNALVGAVFRKDPEIEVPTNIEYIIENANGAKLSLIQIAKACVKNNIEVGRHGLLVDYPKAPSGLSAEESAKYSARILQYPAESIINWKVDDLGSLIYVKLKEENEETDEDEYIELSIEDGLYVMTRKDSNDEVFEVIEPTMYDGSRWVEIPFAFIGSDDNSPNVSPITMLDIVNVSRGHYQNSADYEDLLSFLLPTAYGTVPNKQWMDDMIPGGVYSFGSGGFIPVPEGGSAGILQAQPNQMHQEAMMHKENQMIMLGARLIESGQAAETAEAVRIRYSGENSVLDNIAQNASEAIVDALQWVCKFMGADPEQVSFTLNREFFDTTLSPQEIMALIQLADRGDIGQSDLRMRLRKTGVIVRTDEEIDEENNNRSTL